MIGGCLILWATSLQKEIALSTMEAEYVALSLGMKTLIPMQRIIKDVCIGLDLDNDIMSTIKSEIWEDNARALSLAKLEPPRMTPRSKHYGMCNVRRD